MSPAPPIDPERVLVLAPTAADAALSQSIIADAGLSCHVCPDPESLARSLDDGAGAMLLDRRGRRKRQRDATLAGVGCATAVVEVPIVLLAGAAGRLLRRGASDGAPRQRHDPRAARPGDDADQRVADRDPRAPATIRGARSSHRSHPCRGHVARAKRAAARLRSPQGRVPRHAGARAAQSARADPQRACRSSTSPGNNGAGRRAGARE